MASTYSGRIYELRDLLEQAPAAADERVNQSFIACINNYMQLRQSAMSDLVDFISKASISNSGTQAKWQSRITRFRSDYNALFGDSVRDLKLPSAHQLFWTTALQAEEKFFDSLSRVSMPQLTDDLLKHQDNLSKLITALQDTWTFLLSKNNGIQTDEMRAMQDMDQMVQGIVSELDSSSRMMLDNSARAAEAIKRSAESLKEKIRDGLGRAGGAVEIAIEIVKKLIMDEIKPDGFPDEVEEPIEAMLKEMEAKIGILVERAQKYRSTLASYKDLVSTQKGSVLTLFNKTRKDIDAYLENNNISKAKVWLDQAKGQLNDWVSGLPTSGQRDDGAIFRNDIYHQLDDMWKTTVDLDAKFRSQFQGAFLSPLSNETIETLAHGYLFREQLRKTNSRDAARMLSAYRENLPEQLHHVEESFVELNDPVAALLESLPSEVRDLARSRNKDFQEYAHDRIKRQMESLFPAIDELKQILTPSNVESDFNCQELEDMLH